jgi:hypothetical protein
MRLSKLAIVLAAAFVGDAAAQHPFAASPGAVAELEAGHVDIRRAEVRVNAGLMGPGSEACLLMTSALVHYVKAAVEAGAPVRVAEWQDLLPEERKIVSEKLAGVVSPFERNHALQKRACRP